MKTLRIIGVPEHFNFPWKKVIAQQPFLSAGITLAWKDESRGSGQMNAAIREDEADIAIILTESFLKDFEDGNSAKLIGFHVNSPLIWGIHVHPGRPETTLQEISNPSFLISRMGSGSQLMAYVLAQKENWPTDSLNFKVVGNLPGALEAMNSSSPELFLWEKYTTKPWVDSQEMKRIGEVASPWPCFVTVASDKALSEFGEVIFELRDIVYEAARESQQSPQTVEIIAENYDLKQEDVEAWLSQTQWATDAVVSRNQMDSSMSMMVELGILKNKLDLADFLTVSQLSIVG